ncbi:unnamed protein product, partial [Allacma fusca]
MSECVRFYKPRYLI